MGELTLTGRVQVTSCVLVGIIIPACTFHRIADTGIKIAPIADKSKVIRPHSGGVSPGRAVARCTTAPSIEEYEHAHSIRDR